MGRHGKQWIAAIAALALTITSVPQNFFVLKNHSVVLAKEKETLENSEDIQKSNFVIASLEERSKEKEEQDYKIAEQQINSYRDIEEAPPLSVSEYKNYIPQNYATQNQRKYDPRTDADFKNNIPEIRNQNPLGTCWAHSAMFLVEMNLAKRGALSSPEDMSEFQTVFFMNHDWDDPLGLCSNDNFHVIEGSSTTLASDWYTHGGNTSYTKFMLMDWIGAVSEKQYPETRYDILTEKEASASLTDDFAITKDMAHVQNVNVINTKDKDVMKQMILEYGAIGISYYDDYKTYYKSDLANKIFSYYNPVNKDETNHAVAVVGWDDDYSAKNFKQTPPGDGAWLIRNSWGSGFGDGGYFWISYYDVSLAEVAYAIQAYDSKEKAHYYQYNYQYDGGIGTGKFKYGKINDLQQANVFEAHGKETLQAVAVYTEANYEYTIEIYKNLTDATNPTSGTLEKDSVITMSMPYEGYHTIELEKTVELNAGDVFAVVVKVHNNNETNEVRCAIDMTYQSWIYSKVEALEGQSFIRLRDSSAWIDVGMENSGNLRIKAYTVDAFKKPITEINIQESTVAMNTKDIYNLLASDKMSVMPLDYDEAILYSSSNETVATVNSYGLITAIKPGKAVITAKNRTGTIQDSIEVTVLMKTPTESITFSVDSVELVKGEKKKIEAVLTPENTDDYPTWSSSDTVVAKVDEDGYITGIEEGTAIITATTQSGKKAECEVKVVTRAVEEINCKFDKLPNKVYKYGTYNIEISNAMKKLSPVKIEWSVNTNNVQVTPKGTNGEEGCKLYVKNVKSVNGKGEGITLIANVSYIKKLKKGSQIVTKIYKKKTTSYNLSYSIKLNKSSISFKNKNENVTVEVSFNDGNKDDQPTNTKVKWMITDSMGKKDQKGSKVASVNGKGVVKPKGPGTTYVTAYAVDSYVKESKNYTVYATIPIVCTPISSIKFTESLIKFNVGDTANLREKLIFNDGSSEEPYNKDSLKLKWMITDSKGEKAPNGTKIVTINGKGVAKPKGPGITYITVYVVDSYVKSSKTYTVYGTIQIECTPVSSIGFNETSISLNQNKTINLKERLIFNDGASIPYNKDGMKLNWSSNDRKNVSVDGKGIVKVNKKAAAGNYTITVKATGGVQKGMTVPEGKITIVVPQQEG